MKQPILIAENVGLAIDNYTILQDINFTVNPGEFVGIIGPNGAGKSTLLKSLRGIHSTIGTIEIFGENLHTLSEKQIARKVAYMQQEINTGFGFSAKQVVLAGRYPYLEWWQNESEEDYAIAEKYMKFTGVSHLADKDINHMSGGEKQRVLLAKVLTQETDLIFLDEPTASLDLTYQEEIFRQCKELCRQGKTILIVVHDIRLAAKFCSRLILLNKGNVLADGLPEEVITTGNLHQAYQMNAAVFNNYVSGLLDIYTYHKEDRNDSKQRIHIISGGGIGSDLIRKLYEQHYKISTGVLSTGDGDAIVASAFNAKVIYKEAFAPIDESSSEENRMLIAHANFTVLCNIAYGINNLMNLKDAFIAKQLIVLEDTPIEERDYTNGEAKHLYDALIRQSQVQVMTTNEFMHLMEQKNGVFKSI